MVSFLCLIICRYVVVYCLDSYFGIFVWKIVWYLDLEFRFCMGLIKGNFWFCGDKFSWLWIIVRIYIYFNDVNLRIYFIIELLNFLKW